MILLMWLKFCQRGNSFSKENEKTHPTLNEKNKDMNDFSTFLTSIYGASTFKIIFQPLTELKLHCTHAGFLDHLKTISNWK